MTRFWDLSFLVLPTTTAQERMRNAPIKTFAATAGYGNVSTIGVASAVPEGTIGDSAARHPNSPQLRRTHNGYDDTNGRAAHGVTPMACIRRRLIEDQPNDMPVHFIVS